MKMKRTRIIAGLIVLSMIALASFASLATPSVHLIQQVVRKQLRFQVRARPTYNANDIFMILWKI